MAFGPLLLLVAAFAAPEGVARPAGFVGVAASWIGSFVFILHAARSGHVPANRKALWIVLMLIGNAIVLPFYWLRHGHAWEAPRDGETPASGAMPAGERARDDGSPKIGTALLMLLRAAASAAVMLVASIVAFAAFHTAPGWLNMVIIAAWVLLAVGLLAWILAALWR